jgi:hypothetical protein
MLAQDFDVEYYVSVEFDKLSRADGGHDEHQGITCVRDAVPFVDDICCADAPKRLVYELLDLVGPMAKNQNKLRQTTTKAVADHSLQYYGPAY